MAVCAQKESHEDSRVEPIIKDLQMLRGLFMSALRKGTLEKEELKKNPTHYLQHDYHLVDMDFSKEAMDMEGIDILTPDVKNLIKLSNTYASDRSDANLDAIIEVRLLLFAAVHHATCSATLVIRLAIRDGCKRPIPFPDLFAGVSSGHPSSNRAHRHSPTP